MARIKYSALVENIRGSIGGTTFQRNAYGYTVKSKPNIVNPQTPVQRRRKVAMQQAQTRWRQLSDANRATWETYATNYPVPSRLNPDAYLGGQQLFMRWNMLGALVPAVAEETVGDPNVITNPTFRIVIDGAQLLVEGTYDSVEGDFFSLAFVAPRLSVTQNVVKSKLRFIQNGDTGDNPFYIDITERFVQIFGYTPIIGDVLGLQVIFLGDENAAVVRTQPVYLTIEAI